MVSSVAWGKIRTRIAVSVSALIFAAALAGCAGTRTQATSGGDASCDRVLPPLTTGFGANGRYGMKILAVRNPSFGRSPVLVFMPQGAPGRRPVVFFSHGYGPNRWETYADLIRHVVSRGYILVYSTYPALFAGNGERYDALRSGFDAAVEQLGKRMDLSRVGYLGHSFGGGATPSMAYQGIVKKGWGKKGAFMMEMAPWYVYEMSASQWRRFPKRTRQLVEVYDKDDINDHRMAIDIFKHSPMPGKYFLMVRSEKIGDCDLVADHSTPGRSEFLRQKQYAVFAPFDALAECTFTGARAACRRLATGGRRNGGGRYHPLSAETTPSPAEPESFYKFPWSSDRNPRRR